MSSEDKRKREQAQPDANRDPITGAPGSHPLGTGVGAVVGGAAAGAATGTVAGPIGTVVGAAVGAVAGGLVGKEVAEAIDPTAEQAWWRDNHASRDHAAGSSFDDFGPAYSYGVDAWRRHPQRRFDDIESELSTTGTRRVVHRASNGAAPVLLRVTHGIASTGSTAANADDLSASRARLPSSLGVPRGRAEPSWPGLLVPGNPG